MSITVTQLAANLPAGVTLDPTAYPGTAQAIRVIVDLLDAFNETQAAFNATAPAGTDVLSLAVGQGNEQTIFWPPGQTTTTETVRPKTYTLTSFQRSTVSDVYPVVG
ncbi:MULTISPECIES: hypothetical protein [unclassified Microcoleus]|uniref:hypothetical protein n=1 Tax=unclassified Microcoleus TaxID=2642155 RepID=UPI002FD51159